MLKKPYLKSKICNIIFWIENDPPPPFGSFPKIHPFWCAHPSLSHLLVFVIGFPSASGKILTKIVIKIMILIVFLNEQICIQGVPKNFLSEFSSRYISSKHPWPFWDTRYLLKTTPNHSGKALTSRWKWAKARLPVSILSEQLGFEYI